VISQPGNNAVIQLVPEPPINLLNDPFDLNDPTTTSDIQIHFTWEDGLNNGGTPVLDYAVYSDEATGNWILLDNAVPSNEFTHSSVTAGLTYTFKVTSRNTVGSSLDSQTISILAAKQPDAPLNLQNVPGLTSAYQIGVKWDDGSYDGASPVIDYELSYKEASSDTWIVWSNTLLVRTDIITGLTPG
jgi:hypothetical protein